MPSAPKLPLSDSLPYADRIYFSLSCRGCGRLVSMGVKRAVRLAGGLSAEEWLARLRCTECGHRGVMIQVAADTRGVTQQEREGPLPVTLEE